MSVNNKILDAIALATYHSIDFCWTLNNPMALAAVKGYLEQIAQHSVNKGVQREAREALEAIAKAS